jgi:hypothetical protein
MHKDPKCFPLESETIIYLYVHMLLIDAIVDIAHN